MKKYQRLLLISVSIISLALFLIYRQQYIRLRHVLEVFNFFGTPCNITDLQKSDSMLLKYDWGPQPMWQQVDDKRFVFSAFLMDKNLVQGLGLRHASVTTQKTCFLFFEGNSKPVKGKVTEFKIKEGSGFIFYSYSCVFLTSKSPYAVSFKSQSDPKHVYSLISNNNPKSSIKFNATVCVLPSQVSKKFIFEFISFHSMLGIESFILYYEQNMPYNIIKLLNNFSNNLNLWINFYPYNKPMTVPKEFTNILLEHDCQLRTKNQAKYSVTIRGNDYIVPSIDYTKPTSERLPIKYFCLNHVNKNHPVVLQNYELLDDYNLNEVVRLNKYNISKLNKSINIPSIFENNCVIHRYEKCDRSVKTKTDYSMKRFSTDLTRTTLVQLLMHDDN